MLRDEKTTEALQTRKRRWRKDQIFACQKAEIGDFTYFTSLTWITEWSVPFNSDVREGNLKFSDFLAQKLENTNLSLRGMILRINGR